MGSLEYESRTWCQTVVDASLSGITMERGAVQGTASAAAEVVVSSIG